MMWSRRDHEMCPRGKPEYPFAVIGFFSVIALCLCECGGGQFRDRREEAASTEKQELRAPVAKAIPKVDTVHGEVRIDKYHWLRDRSDPDVIEYLEAENRYTEVMMKHTNELQESLYRELLSRIKETDTSVPEKLDDYYYYSRTEAEKQYRIYCRKKGSLCSIKTNLQPDVLTLRSVFISSVQTTGFLPIL